jgi:hypothetical protein
MRVRGTLSSAPMRIDPSSTPRGRPPLPLPSVSLALIAGACAGCGPTYEEVGGAALLAALPTALVATLLVFLLELRWTSALPSRGSFAPHAALGAGLGAIATLTGALVISLAQRTRGAALPFGSWSSGAGIGMLMVNPFAITLALIAWRLTVRRHVTRARVVALAGVQGAYWALALAAIFIGRAREFDEVLGIPILYGGGIGAVPLALFLALFVEGYLRDRALRRATLSTDP